MESTKAALEARGYIDESQILNNNTCKESLRKKLLSSIPTERTKAAILIKKNNFFDLIPDLIDVLQGESKLYCKIAISKSLINFEDKSVKMLIPHLGKIGTNQHAKLPDKPFSKDSYPLPRDITARILVNIGACVIPELITDFKSLSRLQILEAIDVLGHVSFYTKNKKALSLLLKLYKENKNDNIMRWKLIRAFSAFDDDKTKIILKDILKNSKIQALKLEAERSLRLINKNKKS